MLSEFGVHRFVCDLNFELLHRVFNNSSFACGGRFFGAYHLSLLKEIRKNCILLNGNSTVELDFSALHIRMLYHMEGIPYKDDPYSILCEKEEDRKLYKLVQLVAINSSDEKNAIMAIRNEFRKNGFAYDLSNSSIEKLINKFKVVHKPICKYLNSGIGLKLQNLDSKITENILIDLMKEDIPTLPVHDSYIVEEQYKGKLAEKMSEKYEIIIGQSPVIN